MNNNNRLTWLDILLVLFFAFMMMFEWAPEEPPEKARAASYDGGNP